MRGCTAVSEGETGEETDRQKENRQTGKSLCKEMVNLKLTCPWRSTVEVRGCVFANYRCYCGLDAITDHRVECYQPLQEKI